MWEMSGPVIMYREVLLLLGISIHLSPATNLNLLSIKHFSFFSFLMLQPNSHLPHVPSPRPFPLLSLTGEGSRLLRPPHEGGCTTGGYK